MPKVAFDGTNRLVTVNSGITALDVAADLYGDWKEWAQQSDNAKFSVAFRAVGGDPTVSGKKLGSTYFLLNGWRIRPCEMDHTLIVSGNLYTEEGASPYLPTMGGYTAAIISEVSNIVDKISVMVDKAKLDSPPLVFANGRPYVLIAAPDLYG